MRLDVIGERLILFALLVGVPSALFSQIAVSGDALPGTPAVVPVPGAGGRTVKAPAIVVVGPDGLSMPVSKQEALQLVAANVPGAAATAYGGDYILSQTCSGYGTLTLQVRGPDGSTWLNLLSKTASDAGSGTGLALGSYAVVRVTVTGTTGCNAILARVPA